MVGLDQASCMVRKQPSRGKNWRDTTTHLRLDRSSSLTFAELARTMQPEEEEAAAALGARSHGCTGAKKVRGSIQASSSPCVPVCWSSGMLLDSVPCGPPFEHNINV